MQARNETFTEGTRKQIAQLQELGWYHSIELRDGSVIEGFQSIDRLKWRLSQFPVPNDLRGKRVLDIGAWDGWFSFEMERRGAEVVALDSAKQTRFLTARELLGSQVEYRIGDICRLGPRELGYFDIVLFMGVLYHVKHPVLALENVCAMTRDQAFVESYVTDDGSDLTAAPVLEFYETTELRGQFDNWVGPNTSCLLAMCRTAGFPCAELISNLDSRAHVTCHRRWDQSEGPGSAPYILSVENSVSNDLDFSANRDDYLTIWFTADQSLTRERVFPRVGDFGSRAVYLEAGDHGRWRLNCKLPPGLDQGWHEVTLQIEGGALSNRVRIGVDCSAIEPEGTGGDAPEITLLTDGKSWQHYAVRAGANSSISIWARGLPSSCSRRDVTVRLNGWDLPAVYLSEPDTEGLRQINAILPSGLGPGPGWFTVALGDSESRPVRAEIFRE